MRLHPLPANLTFSKGVPLYQRPVGKVTKTLPVGRTSPPNAKQGKPDRSVVIIRVHAPSTSLTAAFKVSE